MKKKEPKPPQTTKNNNQKKLFHIVLVEKLLMEHPGSEMDINIISNRII